MPALVIDVQLADDLRDVVHRAVEAVAAGKVVAVPTETVYGLMASALCPDAVERVFELKGRSEEYPLAIAAKSLEDALDYVPNMSLVARRLGRRCWPGPLTLVHAVNSDSVIHRIESAVKSATIPHGKLGLRVPDHEITRQIMRLSAGPLVMTSANRAGEPAGATGQSVAEALGDEIDLILDDGECQFGVPSSIVEVDGSAIKVLREGSLDTATLKKMSGFMAMIVCTGNTCRSPMGEALFKQLIADKLGCSIDELPERGVQVASAGIAAMPGGPAAPQAVEVMRGLGLEIGDHASQPITPRLAQWSDLILTMTNSHRQALISRWPLLEPRIKTLRTDGCDVSDPIGSPIEVYDACAGQIREHLATWVNAIDWTPFQQPPSA